MTVTTKQCIDCGREFDGRSNQIRCPECQAKFRKVLMKYRPRPKNLDKPKYYFTCGHTDCRYALTSDSLFMCDYMAVNMREHPELENHQRPCKATPECSCYEKGKRKRRVYYGKGLSSIQK